MPDREKDRMVGRLTNKQIDKLADKQNFIQDGHTDRKTDRQKDRKVRRYTNRQIEKLSEKQKDVQMDKLKDKRIGQKGTSC